MRCPDCAKFVGFGELNVDEIEAELDEDSGELSVTGRLVLPCAECGADLKALDVQETEDLAELFAGEVPEGWEAAYELDGDPDIEATDRVQTTDRKGKPIKSARYMKTFRGVRVSGTVTRTLAPPEGDATPPPPPETAEYELAVEEQASAFEECA